MTTEFSNESIIIDRGNSSAAAATTPGIDTSNEAGKLRLFDLKAPNGSAYMEPLQLTIVVDGGVVEVYANERFVLSTWVWYVIPKSIEARRVSMDSPGANESLQDLVRCIEQCCVLLSRLLGGEVQRCGHL